MQDVLADFGILGFFLQTSLVKVPQLCWKPFKQTNIELACYNCMTRCQSTLILIS